MVLAVVRVGAATEVEVETRASVVSVKFRGGAAGVVEATPGISERTLACVVTSFVVAVLQSVAADVGTDVVVGATWRVAGVGDSEVVAGGGGVVCRIVSVVEGSDVPSGIVTGVTNLVVSAETVEGEVAVVMDGEVWRREEVVEPVLGKPAGVVVLVVDGNVSRAMAFVVPVSAEVSVLETVVQSVATESETPVKVVEAVVGVTVGD